MQKTFKQKCIKCDKVKNINNFIGLSPENKYVILDNCTKCLILLHNDPVTTKKCTKCKLTKSFDDYNKNVETKDGYNVWCKACYNFYKKQYNMRKKKNLELGNKDINKDSTQ